MAYPFVGEVMLGGFNFAPYGWALCQGQILAISSNTALFSLLGTYYGGNGTSTFQLPNLMGQVPISSGQGLGLSDYVIGESLGVTTVTLNVQEVPSHNHLLNAGGPPPRGQQPSSSPANNFFGENANTKYYAAPGNLTAALNAATIQPATGGPVPHDNMMPYLTLNWCIALQGVYPQRS